MPADDYGRPHVMEFFDWVEAVHGDNRDEVLHQYQALVEVCPLVFKDLEIYCFAAERTYVRGDPTETARREGMREVVLRIKALAELTDKDIAALEDGYATRSDTRQRRHRRREDAYFGRRFGNLEQSGSGEGEPE